MHLDTYTERLRDAVAAAVALADSATQEKAQRLLLALDPAVRVVLLESLSDAAAEISTAIPGASIEARLRGRDLDFVAELADHSAAEPPEGTAVDGTDEDGVSGEGGRDLTRITLRLPEHLKTRAEELAAGQGQSLNAWLVDAVRRASNPIPTPPTPPPFPGAPGHGRSRRLTGWA